MQPHEIVLHHDTVRDNSGCIDAHTQAPCASDGPRSPFCQKGPRIQCARPDGCSGLKRAAIALGTFLVLSSGASLAQDQLSTANLVQLVVTLGVYDNRCEKLAPRLLADVQRLTLLLNKAAVAAGVISEQDNVDKAGEAKWCDTLRPVVEKFKDGLFDPTRPG
jgi:hypothetical protein